MTGNFNVRIGRMRQIVLLIVKRANSSVLILRSAYSCKFKCFI